MSGRWAEFVQMDKSRACARGEHGGCAHFAGPGAGFNPRRLRPEIGAGLCPRSCHSSCPVALSGKRMTVPVISGNPLPAIRGTAEGLLKMGRDIHAISRFFRSGS